MTLLASDDDKIIKFMEMKETFAVGNTSKQREEFKRRNPDKMVDNSQLLYYFVNYEIENAIGGSSKCLPILQSA